MILLIKMTAWTLVHWASELLKLLAQQENLLVPATRQDFLQALQGALPTSIRTLRKTPTVMTAVQDSLFSE